MRGGVFNEGVNKMKDEDKTKEQIINELIELRQHIAELEASNIKLNFYRFAIDNMQDYKAAIIGRDYRYKLANKWYINEYMMPESEIIGKHVAELMGDEVFEQVIKPYLDSALNGQVVQYSTWFNFPHRGRRFMEVYYYPIKNGQQRVDSVAVVVQDITKRKQAEKALQESEKKYRDLYDNAPDMYHSIDKNGIIIDCNETWARMVGYKKEDIIGRHLTEFFTAESKRLFERDFPRLNYEKAQLNLEREFVRKDGTVFPASLNVFSEFDEDGKLIRTKTIARDITEYKRVEKALRQSEEEFRLLFETAADAIFWADPKTGLIINCNKAAETLLERKREEIIGVPSNNPSSTAKIRTLLQEVQKTYNGERGH